MKPVSARTRASARISAMHPTAVTQMIMTAMTAGQTITLVPAMEIEIVTATTKTAIRCGKTAIRTVITTETTIGVS